jgi:signal transduction histidine kinase
MAGRIEQSIKNERELLTNISHEIRTPLARIRVALELCAEDGDGDGYAQMRDRLAGISRDAAELEQLVEDVFMTAKLDGAGSAAASPGLVIRPRSVEVATVVDEAAALLAELHPDARLELDVPSELPPLEADPSLLRRLILNLLDNAAKYSEPESPIELTMSVDGPEIVVDVGDRGIGVPEEDLDRLFEPFFRTDRSRSRGTGGVGLGLALCKRIVEAHEGHIVASPRQGGGTTFRVTLPL